MRVYIKVPKSVTDKLANNETVEAITDFDNPYSKEAYQALVTLTGLPNFFFGLGSHIESILSLSNDNNVETLALEVPNNELHAMYYYDFSALILDYEEGNLENIKRYQPSLLQPLESLVNQPGNPIQFIFKEIRPEMLVKYLTH